MVCLACFLISSRTTCLRVVLPIVNWVLPHQSLSLTDLPMDQSDEGIFPIKNPYSQLYLGLRWQKPASPEWFVILTLVLGNKAWKEMDVTNSNGNKCIMQFTCISTDKELEGNVCAQIAFFFLFFFSLNVPSPHPIGWYHRYLGWIFKPH